MRMGDCVFRMADRDCFVDGVSCFGQVRGPCASVGAMGTRAQLIDQRQIREGITIFGVGCVSAVEMLDGLTEQRVVYRCDRFARGEAGARIATSHGKVNLLEAFGGVPEGDEPVDCSDLIISVEVAGLGRENAELDFFRLFALTEIEINTGKRREREAVVWFEGKDAIQRFDGCLRGFQVIGRLDAGHDRFTLRKGQVEKSLGLGRFHLYGALKMFRCFFVSVVGDGLESEAFFVVKGCGGSAALGA